MGMKDKIADTSDKDANKDDAASVNQPYDETDPKVRDGVKDPMDLPPPNMLRNMDPSGKQQPNQAD